MRLPRGSGAISSMRTGPNSRSWTVESAKHATEEQDHPEDPRQQIPVVRETFLVRHESREAGSDHRQPEERPREGAQEPAVLAEKALELALDRGDHRARIIRSLPSYPRAGR